MTEICLSLWETTKGSNCEQTWNEKVKKNSARDSKIINYIKKKTRHEKNLVNIISNCKVYVITLYKSLSEQVLNR